MPSLMHDEYSDPNAEWDFVFEEAEQWDTIPLTCGLENPESCESCS